MLALLFVGGAACPLSQMCGTICLNGVVPRKRQVVHLFLTFLHYDVIPSPHNPKELFNLRHASAARNAIERIFGIPSIETAFSNPPASSRVL